MVLLRCPLAHKHVNGVKVAIPVVLATSELKVAPLLDFSQFFLRHAVVLVIPLLHLLDSQVINVVTDAGHGGATLPLCHQEESLSILIRLSELGHHSRSVPGKVGRVGDTWFLACSTLLCRDEDHTEGSSGTIDGGGGCILKHGDIGDVIRIDKGEVRHGDVVYQDKWSSSLGGIE